MRRVLGILVVVMSIGLVALIAGTVYALKQSPSYSFAPPAASVAPPEADLQPPPPASESGPHRNELLLGLSPERILQKRQQLDDSVWAKEIRAQEYERTFIKLWDQMRTRSGDSHVVLEQVPFDTLTIRRFGPEATHRWDIRTAAMTGPTLVLDSAGWRALIEDAVAKGYVLVHSEWHHAAMTVDDQKELHSTVNMKLFIDNPSTRTHLVIGGALAVTWSDQLDAQHDHLIKAVSATDLTLTSRSGDDAFVETQRLTSEVWPGQTAFQNMSPVLVYDLAGQGHPDIIIPSINLLWRNHSTPGHIHFEKERLFARDLPGITAAVIADFSGDGLPDLLVAGNNLPPTLFPGKSGGTFGPGHNACPGLDSAQMQAPLNITAGDVDGDGRVDFFISQYRYLFGDGNMPDPYYDANDGYPSFLFLNNGDGTFRDATISSGLGEKRFRRTNSAALLDLTGSGHCDLMTINDFSGMDIYRNDGTGHFSDVTDQLVDQRSSFGMSSSVADFTGEGKLDIFMSGMGSTTARRLEQLQLSRSDYPDYTAMRMKMAYGNRLLLGMPDHTYQQASFNDQVARTGWSWGTAACDFGNDGLMDLYIANGFMSRSSAKDYCTRFWTQDIYMANSRPNDAFSQVFVHERDRLGDPSWNGFEHKALLMNEDGRGFRDVAYPMNLGFEWDGREVVGVDLDGDGKDDLVILQTIGANLNAGGQEIVHIEHNQLPSSNHWLEVQLHEAPGCSPLGATVTVTCTDRRFMSCIICGDSYRSQHPASTHIGLGARSTITALDIRWIGGRTRHIDHPPIDTVLQIR